MRDLITVAEYTIKEMIKRKSFIISNIIILMIIVIGFNVPNIIDTTKGKNYNEELDTVLIIDKENIYEGSLEVLNDMKLGMKFKIQTENLEKDEIKQKIDDGEIYSALILEKSNGSIDINYVIDSIAMSEIPEEVLKAFSTIYTNLQISKLGLTNEQLAGLNTNFNIQITETNDNPASGNIFVIMILSIILFYAIYFCAYQVSSSITTEKTSKIMETLVTSTKPRTIVLGKTIGIGIVGLLQVSLIILVSIISCNVFLDGEILSLIIDGAKITPLLAISVIIYFILGYAIYSLLYALTGSTVSKPEDINSANGPVAILAVIGFYLAYFSMMNPTSEINIFASMFPFSAPFSMPFRIMLGTATLWQIAISIGIMLISIVLIAHISIKIYSSAIFNYGTKMSIKDILKIYKNKN